MFECGPVNILFNESEIGQTRPAPTKAFYVLICLVHITPFWSVFVGLWEMLDVFDTAQYDGSGQLWLNQDHLSPSINPRTYLFSECWECEDMYRSDNIIKIYGNKGPNRWRESTCERQPDVAVRDERYCECTPQWRAASVFGKKSMILWQLTKFLVIIWHTVHVTS